MNTVRSRFFPVVGICLLAISACTHASSERSDLSIHGISVIDFDRSSIEQADILIDDGRIQAVLPAGSIAQGIAETSLDGRGKFLIPGLIDMHVHLASFEARPEALYDLLASGVTTARDMGSHPQTLNLWRDQIAAGERDGPELIIVGETLNGEEVAAFHHRVASSADASEAIDEMIALGAAQIKVHNSLTADVFEAILMEAEQRSVDVVGHVPAGPGPLHACRLGMDEISHAAALIEALLWRADASLDLVGAITWLNGREGDELFACMRDQAMAFAPNLSMYREVIAQASPEGAAMTERLVDALGAITHRAHRAGVLIIAATDADGGGEYRAFGEMLHVELAMLVSSGLSPAEALATATTNPATHLDRQGDIGVIAPGAQADLVILDANPLEDIAHTRAIAHVIVDGIIHH